MIVLFDLDMTLLDTSAVASLRRDWRWDDVRANMFKVRPFRTDGRNAPHELPGILKEAGHQIGVVTSSPRWYAEELLASFDIKFDVLIAYDDTEQHKPDPEPILAALKELGSKPAPDVFYVGDEAIDVEAAYHAGVTSIGISWGLKYQFEFAASAPDVLIGRPDTLIRAEDFDGYGYIGENYTSKKTHKRHWGAIFNCDEDPDVFSMGRYFTTSDPRHATSDLCAAILKLKNDDGPAELFGKAVGRTISRLDWTPDFVVPVPPKPSQERNRFEKILGYAREYLPEDSAIQIDGLKCVKEIEGYKQMNAQERLEAIQGAFETDYPWQGDKVLIIDDVYTTGATIKECARILKLAGATEVRCLALGKDQRTFVRKDCPACGRSMRIRVNGATGAKFWGCSGYPDQCRNTENY